MCNFYLKANNKYRLQRWLIYSIALVLLAWNQSPIPVQHRQYNSEKYSTKTGKCQVIDSASGWPFNQIDYVTIGVARYEPSWFNKYYSGAYIQDSQPYNGRHNDSIWVKHSRVGRQNLKQTNKQTHYAK